TINPEIQKELESRDIKTYNSYKVSYYANDKARCVEYVSTNTDIDCPDTETLQKDSVISDAFIESHLGFVAKAASGHGGKEVIRISDLSVADKLNSILEKDNLVIQKFIDGPASDVRVYVVGKKIIAAVKRTAPPEDFRSNFSLGGSVDAYKLNDTEINQVNQIINLFDFGMVGIDFIIDKTGNFVFNEIEDVVGSRMLYKTHPDIDILELFISHIS
ncbi:MAG: ATP-grasp domain-containing protein, partial [Eubacterium sp.]|nr:ATP-grasp domain-containing protein [Eubacterium sp.]